MANLPISGFPTGGTIAQAGDEFVIARSGANYKLTSSSISSFVLGGPTTQLGAADVASGAVAQTLQVQSNTGAATTGPNFTIKGSSGTTAGGSIIFQTHNGTAYGNALTIASDRSATFTSVVNFPGNSTINASGTYQAGGTGTPSSAFATTGIFLSNSGALQWSSTNSWSGGSDVFLYRDGQPNTLALKNAGNAQIFRVYSTTASSGSYGIISAGVQPDGSTAQADTLYIGSAGAGTAMTKLALVVNGTSALSFSGTAATFAGDITALTRTLTIGNVGLASTGYLAWTFRGGFYAYGDGQFRIRNNADSGDTTLVWGSATSSFPALKRSSATLQVRLADDTGDAAFQCGTQTAGGTAFNVNGTGGNSIASVTNTTTGTLLQVLNSTSNPLMTVTDTTSGTLFSVQSTTAATLFSVNDTTSGTLLAVTNSSATDVFTVSDAGVGTFASNVSTTTGFYTNPSVNSGMINAGANNVGLQAAATISARVSNAPASGDGFSGISSLGITSGISGGPDVILFRDNAAELALRNGNNGQIFRVYGRYTDGSNYERFFINAPTTAGTAVQIGTQKAGSGTARALELQTDGTTRLEITGTGGALFNYAYWHFRSTGSSSASASVISPSNGVMTLGNYNADDFDRLQFGGTASSFPALKRIASGNCLQVIGADNSASAGFIVGNQALATNATDGFLYIPTCAGTPTGVPTTQTGTAPLVVDSTNNKLYVYVGGAWTAMN